MKRGYRYGFIIVIIVTLLIGCSGGSKEANGPTPNEQQTAQSNNSAKKEAKNEGSSKSIQDDSQKEKVVVAEKSNVVAAENVERDYTLKGTYPISNGDEFIIEVDKSQEVVKGVPVNYLYIKHGDNGMKKLLAQSVDRGDDWTNSVATILNPTLSNDGMKAYFETDATFTRTSGYGARNHRTYWVDLGADMETIEHYYFAEGGIKKLLDSSSGPYADHLILEINSLDKNGQPTYVYPVVSPQGEQVVILDSLDPDMNFKSTIDSKLRINNAPKENTNLTFDPSEVNFKVVEIPFNGVFKDDLRVTYHGEYIEHSRYAAVVVEDYPSNGTYPFKYAMYYDNPAYSDHPNTYTLAVMGEIYNVWIKSKRQMDSDYSESKIANKLEDSLIEVSSNFPTDFSVDVITFEDYAGKSYSVNIDDMKEEKSVIAVKLPY